MCTQLTKCLFGLSISLFLFIGCQKSSDTELPAKVKNNSLAYTECLAQTLSVNDAKFTEQQGLSYINLKAIDNNMMQIMVVNTYFCCGLDSIVVASNIKNNNIGLELVEYGVGTYCFCPRDLSFRLDDLKKQAYNLRLLGSVKYSNRDTFDIEFTYSADLDTTIFASQNN